MKPHAFATPHETGGPEPAADGIVVLGRTDGPPLRFRGSMLTGTAQEAVGARLEVALWRRTGGGYAVSARFEDTDADGRCRRSFAATADTIDAAMHFLEEVTLVGAAAAGNLRREAREPAEAAAGRCFGLCRQAALRAAEDDLRGEALAGWALLEGAESG